MIRSTFSERLISQISEMGIIAAVTIDNVNDAVPLADALQRGGIACLELTLRTANAFEALHRIRAEIPNMMIGVGTILSPRQVKECSAAGAAFGFAPGTNPKVIASARMAAFPFAPGVCTPTDIELALENGCRLLKFFPCEPCGGLSYLRSIAAPFVHLGLKFIPLGGISPKNFQHYLDDPMIAALGGSWIAPRDLIQQRDWSAITRNAKQASEIALRVRGDLS